MKNVMNQYYTKERSLFRASALEIVNCVFEDGESSLKESNHIRLFDSRFQWKYPLWYSNDIYCEHITLKETARSGIWYTNNIIMKNCLIEAPKTFRKSNGVVLHQVQLPNAEETFWNCSNVDLTDVEAKGDYFAMGCENMNIDNFKLIGNYAFDGAKNIEIHHATLASKDAFWNCENVTVYDSTIVGEYLGWNSKNIRFVNCTIESLQGMCYMDHVVLKDCKLINTTLAFEYSTVEASISSSVDSIKNPLSGSIYAHDIQQVILDEYCPDISKVSIKTRESIA